MMVMMIERLVPRALLVSSCLGLAACSTGPEGRESGAGNSGPIAALTEMMRPPSKTHTAVLGRTEIPTTPGGIPKAPLGPTSTNPVRSRTVQEDASEGSRTDFLAMHMEVLKEKDALEEEVIALREERTFLIADLGEQKTRADGMKTDLDKTKGEVLLLEKSLEQHRNRAEEERGKFLKAERGRLQLEIDLVKLKSYVLSQGVALPSQGNAGSEKGS